MIEEKYVNTPSIVGTVKHSCENCHTARQTISPCGSRKHWRKNYVPGLRFKDRNPTKLLLVLSSALPNDTTPFSWKLINEEKTPQWSYIIHIVIASSLIEPELVKSYWCLAFKYIIQKSLSFFYKVFCLFRLSYTALTWEVLTKRRLCTHHRFYIPAKRGKYPISKPFTDTESFMLEGTFLGYPVQPPQFKKGQLEQGVLNCVQTGFEYLHGWTHLSEQTILLTTFTVNTLPFQNCFSRQTLLTI